MNNVDNIDGKWKNDLLILSFKNSENILFNAKKLKNKPDIFIKNAKVGTLNIYHIHVKICQDIIHQNPLNDQDSDIKCGTFI